MGFELVCLIIGYRALYGMGKLGGSILHGSFGGLNMAWVIWEAQYCMGQGGSIIMGSFVDQMLMNYMQLMTDHFC